MIVRDELACVTLTVDVPAEALWAVLTDFAHPQRLAQTIERCTVQGDVRIVESSRGRVIHERVTECDRAAWRFQYEVLNSGDMPFAAMTAYRATVTLTPLESACTSVEWRCDGTVEGDSTSVVAAIDALYRSAIANLAREAVV